MDMYVCMYVCMYPYKSTFGGGTAGMKLLPARWITLPPSQLHALLICYETGAREGLAASVDWRRVMWSLADVPQVPEFGYYSTRRQMF